MVLFLSAIRPTQDSLRQDFVALIVLTILLLRCYFRFGWDF